MIERANYHRTDRQQLIDQSDDQQQKFRDIYSINLPESNGTHSVAAESHDRFLLESQP